jgi:hypothetical protein
MVKESLAHLDLRDAPELVKVIAFSAAQVSAVVIHWVSDRTGTLKDLRGSEALFMERLKLCKSRF